MNDKNISQARGTQGRFEKQQFIISDCLVGHNSAV